MVSEIPKSKKIYIHLKNTKVFKINHPNGTKNSIKKDYFSQLSLILFCS